MLIGAVRAWRAAARAHPLRVVPRVLRVPHDRCGRGRMLRARRERIRLVARVAVGPGDRELVARAVADVRERRRPDPARLQRLQRIRARAPAVPVADQADRARVRRPHREVRAVRDDVCAELVVEPVVRALVEQEQVVGGQHRRRIPGTARSCGCAQPAKRRADTRGMKAMLRRFCDRCSGGLRCGDCAGFRDRWERFGIRDG